MLQDIRLKDSDTHQFLGDLFEGFLTKGVKQSEGQFFTPMPIVRFIVTSLPLEQLIKIVRTYHMPLIMLVAQDISLLSMQTASKSL